MADVFLSYTRRDPDRRIVTALAKALTALAVNAFFDSQIEPGEDWPDRLDDELARCRTFVILVSTESQKSCWVRQELTAAANRNAKTVRALRILPVLIDLSPREYDNYFGAYLRRIQPIEFSANGDVDELAATIHAAIRPESESGAHEPFPISSTGYEVRPVDEELNALLQKGQDTVTLRGPRHCGMTSMLLRAHAAAGNDDERMSCYVSLERFRGQDTFDGLCLQLAHTLGFEFGLENPPEDIWNEARGGYINLTHYIEAALLGHRSQVRKQILFDDVDSVVTRDDVGLDFATMVREWQRRQAGSRRGWEQLSLVLGYSLDPSRWITNVDKSPFTVGKKLEITDFTAEDIMRRIQSQDPQLGRRIDVEKLTEWVGGHPVLMTLAVNWLMDRSGASLEDLKRSAEQPDGAFRSYLRQVAARLREHPELMNAFCTVLQTGKCSEDRFDDLYAFGLVAGASGSRCEPRSPALSDYLGRELCQAGDG
ncbi:MAG: AAA-like domain-containing protein [bacterium]|nr:AAA-like domain-containing protein [bacterium]